MIISTIHEPREAVEEVRPPKPGAILIHVIPFAQFRGGSIDCFRLYWEVPEPAEAP